MSHFCLDNLAVSDLSRVIPWRLKGEGVEMETDFGNKIHQP